MKTVRTLAIFLCALAGATTGVRADERVSGSFGLSLAPLIGEHVESDTVDHPAPIPIPIGQITLRYRPVEIFFESLPGSPAIPQGSSAGEVLATHLAFLDTVARIYEPRQRFWAGAGELVYNQSSTYVSTDRFLGDAVSTSRVAGGRYEVGTGLTRDPQKIKLWVDVMPALHGVNDQYDRHARFTLPENGSQFETQLAVTNAHGPFEFDYGLRYLNYVAHYTHTRQTMDGAPADRNTGVLPYATFAFRFGAR